MKPSEADRLRIYRREGYVVLPGLLGPDEVAILRAESDHVAERLVDEALAVGGVHPRVHAERREERVVLVKVSPLGDTSPPFARIAVDPRVTGVAAALLGDEAVLLEEKLNYKQTLPGAPDIATSASETFPFHTDWHYYREDGYPRETLSIAIAIDDSVPENGCLQVVPRSHERDWRVRADGPPDVAAAPAATTDVVLRAGDAVAFVSTLVHGSYENHTEGPRRLLVLSYHPASCDIEFDLRNRGHRANARLYEDRYRDLLDRGAWRPRYRLSAGTAS